MSCGSEPGAQGETSRQPKTGKQIIQLRMSAGEGVVNRKHTAGDSNVGPSHRCFRTEFSTMTCTDTQPGGLGKVSGLVTTHSCSCHLHPAPPKRVREAKHLSYPSSQPLGTPLPSPRIRNKLAPLRQPARKPAVCSQFPLCNRGPSKALPREKKYTTFQGGGGSLKSQWKIAWFCLLTAFLMSAFSGEVSETHDCDLNNYYYLKILIKTGNLRHQSCEVFMQDFYNGANFKYSFYLKHCILHFQSSACKVQC